VAAAAITTAAVVSFTSLPDGVSAQVRRAVLLDFDANAGKRSMVLVYRPATTSSGLDWTKKDNNDEFLSKT